MTLSACTIPPPAAKPRCRTSSRAAPARVAKWWSSAPVRAALKPRASPPSAATKSSLFEAAERPGGQVLLASRAPTQEELIGIIDWRMQRLATHGVTLRFSTYAHVADVLAETPDVVFLATGGVPNTDILETGNDLVVSTWDILSGTAKPAQRVLIYDDNGAHPAMQAAEFLAEAGSTVEIVTPERLFRPGDRRPQSCSVR